MKRSTKGRGLLYTRDSGGNHEMTPGKYVEWAAIEAKKLDVAFAGTPEQIDGMIRNNRFADGDLFLDKNVQGNVFNRPGLDALKAEIADLSVSHIFIPRRDRLARPDNALDGVQLEIELRSAGITIVFMDHVASPILQGERQDLGETIVSLIDYHSAGIFRQELARKIILAQLALAEAGFSTGGRAPYGFRRWLARIDGQPIRELKDGEHVRMVGHHVVWLPSAEDELKIIRRIITMLEQMSANQVCAVLNQERIPSPDANRYRTDNGVKHKVSGLWHQSTIVSIARNRLLVMVATHGKRSMGDQLRMTPNGPRSLNDGDYRGKELPKVVQNPEAQRITARSPVPFEPVVAPGVFEQLQQVLNRRAGTQRGKPRAHDPSKNPLGGRVFDLNCTWPMYRNPYKNSFRYVCGYYQQSHGQQCNHNHIDGPLATTFALSCLRQRLLSPIRLAKIKDRLHQLAERDHRAEGKGHELSSKQRMLEQVRQDLETVGRNLARARDENQYQAIAAEFNQLKAQASKLEAEVASLVAVPSRGGVEAEIVSALRLAENLTTLANQSNLTAARQAIELANVKLFVKFQAVPKKKRVLNEVAGGVVTLGAAPTPITPYAGPTTRNKLKKTNPEAGNAAKGHGGRCSPIEAPDVGSGSEGMSLGNVNRDDRTAIELLLAGIAVSEEIVRRFFRSM